MPTSNLGKVYVVIKDPHALHLFDLVILVLLAFLLWLLVFRRLTQVPLKVFLLREGGHVRACTPTSHFSDQDLFIVGFAFSKDPLLFSDPGSQR